MRVGYKIYGTTIIENRLVIFDGHFNSDADKITFFAEVKLGSEFYLMASKNSDGELIATSRNGDIIQGIIDRTIPDPKSFVDWLKEVTTDLMALGLHNAYKLQAFSSKNKLK